LGRHVAAKLQRCAINCMMQHGCTKCAEDIPARKRRALDKLEAIKSGAKLTFRVTAHAAGRVCCLAGDILTLRPAAEKLPSSAARMNTSMFSSVAMTRELLEWC
jgi:hypothetical protein